MKHLLLTTALVTATATGAFAQSATATNDNTAATTQAPAAGQTMAQSGGMFRTDSQDTELRASDFIGMRIYAAQDRTAGEAAEGAQDNWEDVGEINDVILSRDGEVEAVLLDIGGFLGIGERQVAVQMDSIEFVSDSSTGDAPNDFFLVVNADRATLEGAPAYGQAADGTQQTAATGTAMTGASTDTAAATMGQEKTEADAKKTAEAQSATTNMENTADTAEAKAEEAGEKMEQTAENAADSTEKAAEEVEKTAEAGAAEVKEESKEMTAEANATQPAAQGDATATANADASASTDTQPVATADSSSTDTATSTDAQPMNTASNDTTTMAPAAGAGFGNDFQREGYADAGTDYLTTENLTGARVYDTNDKWVGEISELVVDGSGKITEAIVDVGGFLGIGEKPVALQLSDLKILREDGGDEVKVYTAMAEDQLESMPAFEK